MGDTGLILRYNGAAWQAQAGGTTENLRAVSAYSATNVWAVGDGGTILHYNGTAWNPQSSGTTVNLHGVAAYLPEKVWAVGDNGTVLYYDGTVWSQSSPNPVSSNKRRYSKAVGYTTTDYFGVAYVPQRMLYEIQDNDNIEIFKGQIRAFRKWMKARGQQNKPLIISEYGVLMPVLYGFDHNRVKAFMYASFDYMLTATDAGLGYPQDGNRLVQRWAWYSLNDQPWDIATGEGFNGNLFDPETGEITPLGKDYGAYVLTQMGCGTLPGDLNCDCQVGADDMAIVAGLWRAPSGDFVNHPEYDADGDGDITVGDITWVGARWGNTCG